MHMPTGGTLLTLVAPFVNVQFLGSSLTFMMVRRTPTALPILMPASMLTDASASDATSELAACLLSAPRQRINTPLQVYVWGRRHQYVNLSFLGIFNFTAPYLPWVLLGFSVILGSSPVVDLLGMVAGALVLCFDLVAARTALVQPMRAAPALDMPTS